MSFWSSVGGFVGGALGPIASGLGTFFGQREANEANERIARENRAFQERMSNTAYQRAADDLEKAGLNRILALGSPASSPSGSTATMQNAIGAGVNSALGAKRLQEDIRTMQASRKLMDKQAGAQHALDWLYTANTVKSQNESEKIQQDKKTQQALEAVYKAQADMLRNQLPGQQFEADFYNMLNKVPNSEAAKGVSPLIRGLYMLNRMRGGR